MTTKCSVKDCDREIFNQVIQNSKECILHCEKSLSLSLKEHHNFYNALSDYIEEDTDFISNIHFPIPDNQIRDYRKILNIKKCIGFYCCSFYTNYLDLESEVFFKECVFHNTWSLYNYKIFKNIDNVIYQSCQFKKTVDFTPTEASENSTETLEYDLSNSQFDYSCEFFDNIEINNATIHKNFFNTHQDNYIEENFNSTLEFFNCDFLDTQEIYLTKNPNLDLLFENCTFNEKFKIANIEKNIL